MTIELVIAALSWIVLMIAFFSYVFYYRRHPELADRREGEPMPLWRNRKPERSDGTPNEAEITMCALAGEWAFRDDPISKVTHIGKPAKRWL